MISVNEEIFHIHKFSHSYNLGNLLAKKYAHLQALTPVINVVGTNGKGSVSSYLAEQLENHYQKVGLFTSPAFLYHNERIKINGINISDNDLLRILAMLAIDIQEYQLTFFEIWVLIAMIYFAEQKVTIAIIEAGIGGRFDSTRFFTNQKLGLLTSIGFDHTEILGTTLPEILWNKVTIIRPKIALLISKQCESFLAQIKSMIPLSEIFVAKRYLSAPNIFQEYNIGLVISAMKFLQLKINYQLFTKIPILGRFTILQKKPLVVLDGAHNEQGIELLLTEAKNRSLTKQNTIILYAAADHKNFYPVLEKLVDYFPQKVFLTKFDHPLSWKLKKTFFGCSIVEWKKWLEATLQQENLRYNIIICGSLYFIPQVYLYWQQLKRKEK